MSPAEIWRRAALQAFGGAGAALTSSFFALGALFSESGMQLWHSALCTLIVFALPGQLAAAELYASGAGTAVILITVFLVNLRLMPMTIAILPLLRPPEQRGWRDFAAAHLVAVTSWVSFMGTRRDIPREQRYLYFACMGGMLWLCGVVATMLGWAAGGTLPPPLLAGLLFLNPVYFLCMMLRALARRADAAAMALGMLILPAAHAAIPQWDIILSGVIGGGAAFFLFDRGAPPTEPEA